MECPGAHGVLGPQLAWEKPAGVSVLSLVCTLHGYRD